ncbi:MAG TPA: sugar ABC transporter ATP-binding protein [bacterium]|nr:sugar ABC transporter ATP-binding protein [bacterium]
MPPTLLEAREISKSFPGTRALDRVHFEVLPGEVHALVGENGAGKTTLMMILAGVLQPDEGAILWDGVAVPLTDPRAAQGLGIGTVFQELSLVPGLSIGENIFLTRAPARTALGLVEWSRVYADAQVALAQLGINVDPMLPVNALAMGARQMVEIAKALSLRCRMLLLDEPTSALSPGEVDRLFTAIRALRDQGLGIVFITHRIAEVFQIADRVTVLRDGHTVATLEMSGTTPDEVVHYMVGRNLGKSMRPPPPSTSTPILEVSGLSRPPILQGISFSLYAGEILGVAGLPDSGREELGRTLFGIEPPLSGAIRVEGRALSIRSPQDALRAGIGYLPPDRRTLGLFLRMPVKDNIVVTALDQITHSGIVDDGRAAAIAARYVDQLQVHSPSVSQVVGRLSGGNQQKVALSKWLFRRPRVLIADGPTIGVDVGARMAIHQLLYQLAAEGMSIVLLSTDLPELLGLSNRIMVMNGGRVAGVLAGNEASEQRVITLAAGQRLGPKNV